METPVITQVLVLGAGKVGSTVADMVAEYHRLPVTLADREHPRHEPDDRLVTRTIVDAGQEASLAA
ncbi:MAG TPA: saccharopine dehydrogenase family protein, partial [Variovorax sp.]